MLVLLFAGCSSHHSRSKKYPANNQKSTLRVLLSEERISWPAMGKFAAVPNEVYYALEHGEITLTMFVVLCILHKQADWSTGVVKFTCARTLVDKLSGEYAERTIQKALNNLEKAGFLMSHHVHGSKLNYPVTLNNYEALTGPQKGVVLNPCQIRCWRTNEDLDTGRQGGERYAEGYAEEGCVAATHQSVQESSKPPTSSKPSEKDSLSPSLHPEKSAETEKAQELDVYKLNKEESSIQTQYARAIAATVVETLYGEPWTRYHEEKTLPKFLPLFPVVLEDEESCLIKANHITRFTVWLKSKPKLAAKFVKVDDFFFHWENRSGHEDGLRHQFEAQDRVRRQIAEGAAQADSPSSAVPLTENISVDDLT